jgi:hypothetical protein
MQKLYMAFAFVLTVAASQPAQADTPMAQMIDDTGLVITSNADGSLREFKLNQADLVSLKIFQKESVRAASTRTVLKDSNLQVLANR